MGYRKNFRTFALRYSGDHPLAGFECSIRGMALGETLDLLEEVGSLPDGGHALSGEQRAGLDALYDRLATQIIEWNVEDDNGQPVAPSREALFTYFEGDLGSDILSDWIDIIQGKVSDPKASKRSDSGPQFPGDPLPMAPLS